MKKFLLITLIAAAVLAGCKKDDDSVNKIPDLTFMQYCLDRFDTNKDGRLSQTEVLAVKKIDLPSAGITTVVSMEGIELFNNLTWLDCSGNRISELDVSELTNLTELHCGGNQISELDVSVLTKLKVLNCSNNRISELDVSALTKLTWLYCSNNRILELDVAGLTNLTTLHCSGNKISKLDVAGLTGLTVRSRGSIAEARARPRSSCGSIRAARLAAYTASCLSARLPARGCFSV